MPLNGIDIASWDGDAGIDPVAVAGDFVIVKATQGKGYRNPYYRRHMDALKPSRKFRGAYHYCDTRNKPAEDVANFLAVVAPELEAGSVPLFVDWEEPGQWHLTDWLAEFMALLEAKSGQKPILYTYDNVLRNADFSALEGKYPLWYARYPQRAATGYKDMPKPSFGKWEIALWQYAETGVVPGFSGKPIDLNIFYGTADDWRRLADGTVTPPKGPPKETTVQYKTLRGFTLEESSYWSFLALEELAVLKGWCKQTLDLYQGIGGSSKSGGTHLKPGGAVDFWQGANPRELLRAARNGGIPGWVRTPDQGFAYHAHAGVNLPGRPYSYQIDALRAGYNGLGSGGRSGRDDGPRDGVTFRGWQTGLEWLRNETEKLKADQAARQPAVPRAMPQRLQDFWNGWLAVDRWDNADGDPKDVVLYGISDADLIAKLEAKGFTYYEHADLHERARFLLADFVQGMALENTDRNDNEVAWDVLNRVMDPPEPGVTWVELRPVFSAAHAGGAFDKWGESRTRHSVRTVQEAMNHYSGGSYLTVDGIFGATTRQAVSNWQVAMRGAQAGSAAADGVPGVHDFLWMARACSERTGRAHRARFLY